MCCSSIVSAFSHVVVGVADVARVIGVVVGAVALGVVVASAFVVGSGGRSR